MCRFVRRSVLVLLAGLLSNMAMDGVAQEKAIALKRRHDLTEDDLRKQLNDPIPELGFNQMGSDVPGFHKPGAMIVYGFIDEASKKKLQPPPDVGFRRYQQWAALINEKENWTALPWRPGQASQLNAESAERLQVLSVNLRRYMRDSVGGEDKLRPDSAKLKAALDGRIAARMGSAGSGADVDANASAGGFSDSRLVG